jgi:GntR family transcriptional regulator, transcriptional repressor for pyruvate dehydrogenase complex
MPAAAPTPEPGPASGPRTKASFVVARGIVQTMYEEQMKPGERYLSEADGIRRHQVGRGTYREALRFLEHLGVIVMRSGAGGGPEIAEPSWPHLASAIALLLQFADAPLRTLLEARVAIEPGMAELAATSATDAEVAQMAADLDALAVSLGAYREFSQAYLRYWGHLSASTHNALLSSLSPAMRAIVNSAGFAPNEPYREVILGRLRGIHAAVAAHDGAEAFERMRDLELEYRRRLVEGYPRQVDRVISWSELLYSLD